MLLSRPSVRRQPLLLEPLEDRCLLSAFGTNVLAAPTGNVTANGVGTHSFRISADDFEFTHPKKSVSIQFTATPTDDTFDAAYLQLVANDGSFGTLHASDQTKFDRTSTLVVELSEGDYTLNVRSKNAQGGAYQVSASLVGDVDGNRVVDDADAKMLRSLLNTSENEPGYLLSADYNLDGRISGFDNSMLVRNRGAAFTAFAALDFVVNPNLSPPFPEFPRINATDPEPRTLAVLRTESGVESVFVENELYLTTNNNAELQAFLDRWQGTVISSFEPSSVGYTSLPNMYLVQIRTELADPSGIVEDLTVLDPNGSYGLFEVSSQRGLELLTAAASEAADFATAVGISWIGQPSSFGDGASLEAPSSPIGGYNPNAFTWAHIASNNRMDIGVDNAWKALEYSGRLIDLERGGGPFDEGKRELAIIDNGFIPNDDWPDWVGFTNVGSPLGAPTPFPGKEWHGSNMVAAAAGLPDNQFGAAGPGGPVANIVAVPTTYDPFLTGVALMRMTTIENSVDIVNMSWHTPVPVPLTFSLLPWEAVTATVREFGTLLFASAGNESANIDEEVDLWFFGSFEPLWYHPVENAGVIGVGGVIPGIDTTPVFKAGGSNFGSEDVDIFGPWLTLVAPTEPGASGPSTNQATLSAGTSGASAFTAGVAALIWGANPDLSADDVERTLLETAHSRADTVLVNRWVDAFAAVHRVLGDVPPYIEITRPEDGATVISGTQVNLQAFAEDFEGAVSIVWTSNLQQLFGTGTNISPRLVAGIHQITATVTDSSGQTSSDTITINVQNQPPTVVLVPPLSPSLLLGAFHTFIADTYDTSFGDELPPENVSWSIRSNATGQTWALGQGNPFTVQFDSADFAAGTYTLTVTGIDNEGGSASDSVTVELIDSVGQPPVVSIVEPTKLSSLRVLIDEATFDPTTQLYHVDLSFRAIVNDLEDGTVFNPKFTSWSVIDANGTRTVIGDGATASTRLFAPSTGAAYQIIVQTRDSDGNTSADVLFVTLWRFI